jgi:hypothetical protein
MALQVRVRGRDGVEVGQGVLALCPTDPEETRAAIDLSDGGVHVGRLTVTVAVSRGAGGGEEEETKGPALAQ